MRPVVTLISSWAANRGMVNAYQIVDSLSKILGLRIDGVNQALLERSQFGDLIARNGGSLAALIDQTGQLIG